MRIVSFGRLLPYEGVASAGGQFYLHHLRALSQLGHDVIVIAPMDSLSTEREHLSSSPFYPNAILIAPTPRIIRGVENRLHSLFVGSVTPSYKIKVLLDRRVRRALRRADAIEYQWVETMSLALRRERSRRRPVPLIGVVHDELLQRESRGKSDKHILSRVRKSVRRFLVATRERKSFRRMTALLAISEKDAKLCRKVSPTTDVRVITPPVVSNTPPRTRTVRARDEPPQALFVGAMYREENVHGVKWFLENVWPRVISQHNDARFVIAGSGPTAELLNVARRYRGVSVSGYIPDLQEVYSRADVVVSPIFEGAGVKFKTVTSLALEIPTVSTPIGAEGILESNPTSIGALTTDPAQFALAVCNAFATREGDHTHLERLGASVRYEYGIETYAARLERVLPWTTNTDHPERRQPSGGIR